MLNKLLTILSILSLTKQALAYCNDLNLESCSGSFPIQSLKLESEEICQDYCRQNIAGTCTFFTYDRQQRTCQLYDNDIQEYTDSCNVIGWTPTPTLTECQESQENNKCLVRSFRIENIFC